jgi:hypothetical protein
LGLWAGLLPAPELIFRILCAPAGLLPADHQGGAMRRNVGNADRVARALGALGLLTCAVMAPLPLGVRLAAFALPAVYLLLTAAVGTCLGYSLMGKSTCPAARS